MKKRNLAKMFALTIVTLGIYRLYWFIKTRSEMMKLAKVDIPSPLILAIPFIGFLAAIGLIIADALQSVNENTQGSSSGLALGIFYLAFFLWFIVSALWLWKYSKAVEVITKEKLSFALSLIVLLAVPDGIA